jgi:hypothetical protein
MTNKTARKRGWKVLLAGADRRWQQQQQCSRKNLFLVRNFFPELLSKSYYIEKICTNA